MSLEGLPAAHTVGYLVSTEEDPGGLVMMVACFHSESRRSNTATHSTRAVRKVRVIDPQEADDRKPSPLPEYADQQDLARLWAEAAPDSEPARTRWFLPVVALLLLLNVPWYLPQAFAGHIYAGLPGFVWMALLTSVGLAAVTSFAALREWRDG